MNTPSLLELCDHARTSCRVNGLIPKEWRWGPDVANLYADLVEEESPFADIQMPRRFQGIPVVSMRALGVACIGKKPYVALLQNKE